MGDDPAVHLRRALDALGFHGDPEMAGTPARLAEFLGSFRGAGDPPEVATCAASMPGQVVAVQGVPFHSLCAHHLLPFFGTVSVAYRAGARLAGFGAVPRVVQWAARRPQLQERLAEQIARHLAGALEAQGVLVRIQARQMCVEMRGAATTATFVVESVAGDARGLAEVLRRG